jgi:hypothetical protein
LFGINEKLNETFRNESSELDVEQLVPMDVMVNDDNFFNYIWESNERIGKTQVLNLKKIQAFATNPNLHDLRQGDLIAECLKYWNIPEHTRIMYAGEQPQQAVRPYQKGGGYQQRQKTKIVSVPLTQKQMLNKLNNELRSSKLNWDLNALMFKIKELNGEILTESFKKCSIFDYKCFIACGTLVLLLSCGRSEVYELELDSSTNCFGLDESSSDNEPIFRGEWKKLESIKIVLPKETLILAEKVVEYRGKESVNAIHVIDAFFIEGKNMIINDKKIVSYADRHPLLSVFVKTVIKKSRSDLNNIRVKDMVDFDKIENDILENLIVKKSKNPALASKNGIHLPLSFASEYFVYPRGVYFLKYISAPWSLVASKNTGRRYFYKSDAQISTYELPNDDLLFSNPK